MLITVMAISLNMTVITPIGPAPSSGDGISDGSGLDQADLNDDVAAPNSGDGISDGSGF